MSNIDNNKYLTKYLIELINIDKQNDEDNDSKKKKKENPSNNDMMYYDFEENYHTDKIQVGASHYLLNQIIRQVIPKEGNFYISKKAKKRFEKYNILNHKNYVYIDKIKGNKKFNSIFHDDHIIDVYSIIEELKKIEELNLDNVEDLLKREIVRARILKSEKKKLNKGYK